MSSQHSTLADGRWQQLSLPEQLGNIGSEFCRTVRWQGKSVESFRQAFDRMLELLDLTIAGLRRVSSRRELTRVREVLCDFFVGDNVYQSDAPSLQKYFDQFAMAARAKK